jgi:hypothetical protein
MLRPFELFHGLLKDEAFAPELAKLAKDPPAGASAIRAQASDLVSN